VTDSRFLTSCESATVTDHHPSSFVSPQNYSWLNRGHMRNVRVGPTDAQGNVTVLADVFIKDGDLAERVERGEVRDVSLGYNLELVPDQKGRWFQKNLLANHLAVVERGRAGSTKILDAAPRRSLTAMATDYLGQPIGSVKSRAFDSEETTMSQHNLNDSDDLIPVGSVPQRRTARDEALRWLREIKPEVVASGNRALHDAWNSLLLAIKDGVDPNAALSKVRRQFSATDANPAQELQRVADDFVRTCASYLGQDINEVAAQRRERTVRRALADARTPAADLTATCEAYLGATDIHAVERKLRNRD
jgi:hypothetical protein